MGGREEREAERRDLARINQRKRAERDAAIQQRLDEQAAQENRDSKMDDAFLREAQDMFGIELTEIEEYARDHADSLVDGDKARRVIKEARRQAKGGWLSSPNPRKAARTLKGSKAVRDAAEQARKKKGCFLFMVLAGLALAGVAWSATWGVVELVAAIGV